LQATDLRPERRTAAVKPLRGKTARRSPFPITVIEAPKPVARGPRIWPLDVNADHALGEMGFIPEKTELLYGQVFHKMPMSPFHAYLLQLLREILRLAVPQNSLVRTEQPITCVDSEPESDLSGVRGKLADFRPAHPHTAEFVIEICLSSHEYDRSKLRAYSRARVKECWLVLGPEQPIEVYRQPAGEQFAERAIHGPPAERWRPTRCQDSRWSWTSSSRPESSVNRED